MLIESILVVEDGLLRLAEVVVDGIACDASDGGDGIGDHDAVLDVEAFDFADCSGCCAVVGEVLGDDCEDAIGVDFLAWAIEASIAHAVRVEITSIGIAGSAVAVGGCGASAGIACAHGLGDGVARVGSEGSGDGICLPDVHFCAAGTVVSVAGVGVVGRGDPAVYVCL